MGRVPEEPASQKPACFNELNYSTCPPHLGSRTRYESLPHCQKDTAPLKNQPKQSPTPQPTHQKKRNTVVAPFRKIPAPLSLRKLTQTIAVAVNTKPSRRSHRQTHSHKHQCTQNISRIIFLLNCKLVFFTKNNEDDEQKLLREQLLQLLLYKREGCKRLTATFSLYMTRVMTPPL